MSEQPSWWVRIYLLWEVTSDQYGKSRLVGVFSTEEKAKDYERSARPYHPYIETVLLDPETPQIKMLRQRAQLETETKLTNPVGGTL